MKEEDTYMKEEDTYTSTRARIGRRHRTPICTYVSSSFMYVSSSCIHSESEAELVAIIGHLYVFMKEEDTCVKCSTSASHLLIMKEEDTCVKCSTSASHLLIMKEEDTCVKCSTIAPLTPFQIRVCVCVCVCCVCVCTYIHIYV
jgi:hypothetical protein